MKTKKHAKYDSELREKVIEFIESQNGNNNAASYRDSASRFKIPVGTASAWHHQWRKKIGPWKQKETIPSPNKRSITPEVPETNVEPPEDDLFPLASRQLLELAQSLYVAEMNMENLKAKMREVLDSMEV